MNFTFAWPWILTLLPLPLLAILLPAAGRWRPAGVHFPFPDAVRAAQRVSPGRLQLPRLVLGALAWLLLVVAAARPQSVGETVHVPVNGRSIMLAVDLSGSMQTPDMRSGGQMVSRLAAVKAVAGEFVAHRIGDRLGLILFGDEAYVQVPLTLDRNTVNVLLDEAQIGLAGQQTAIGDAIGLAIKRLRDQPPGNRVLILLTDGASNAGNVDPLKAAQLAAREGVRIYTIGVGAEQMLADGPFGVPQLVKSDLDEGTLKAIAKETGGRYFRATDVAALAQIYALLDKIEPVSRDEQSWRPVKELYALPLALSLVLSMTIAVLAGGLPFRRRLGGVRLA
jgi:Ca-activated chloride channel family protein